MENCVSLFTDLCPANPVSFPFPSTTTNIPRIPVFYSQMENYGFIKATLSEISPIINSNIIKYWRINIVEKIYCRNIKYFIFS